MKAYRLLILGLIALLLFGCKEDSGTLADDEAGSVSEIIESMTGARLRVEVAETQVDLTGVVPVRVTMLWGEGVSVELIEPDWIGAGWAYVTQRGGEIRFDGTEYSQVIDFELEPFLGGEYEVPSIGIRADSDEAGRRIARLSPIGIVVASVLNEADGRDLEPAVGLAEMVAASDVQRINWGLWIGLGIAIVSGLVILWLRVRRSEDRHESIDPKTLLVIAADAEELSDVDLGALHKALVVLSKDHGQLRSISHEIERERFSGSAVNHQRVQSAARRAVEVCTGSGALR